MKSCLRGKLFFELIANSLRCSNMFPDKAKDTQNVGRRKLADISNQPQNQRLLVQEKSQSTETNIKECIHKLQKVTLFASQFGYLVIAFHHSSLSYSRFILCCFRIIWLW